METIEQKIIRLAPLIETFRVINTQGSLTAAGNQLRIGKSVISKRLSQLEGALGVKLFERTTRRLELTGAGHKLFKQASSMHHGFSAIFDEIEQWHSEPKGKLRITSADILSVDTVNISVEFQKKYPNVVPVLDSNDYKIDLIANRYDIGLRYGWTDNENLVAKYFVRDYPVVFVVRSDQIKTKYLNPELLSDLPWVVPDPTIVDFRDWVLTTAEGQTAQLKYEPAIICRHSIQIKEMLFAGAGVVCWPQQQIKRDIESGLLTELIPDWKTPQHQIYAMYPSTSSLSRNAQLWLETAENYYRQVN